MQFLNARANASVRFAPRLKSAIVVAIAATAGLFGCDDANVPPIAPTVSAQTPEAQFELAMTRLQSALADAQAAASSGVKSERTSDYRLIPPKEIGGQYTAEVTIKTKIALANAPAAATLPKPVGEEETPLNEELPTDEDLISGEIPAAKDEDVEVETEEADPDNGVTRKAIAQSMEQETNVYQLAYEGDRWKLLTEPKSETEKLVFEYALGK